MYYNIYIDVVFVTNLLMDYILLRIVGRLFLIRGNRLRSLFAAAMGALFSCLILYVPTDGFLPVLILLHGGCAVGMLILGCGLKKGGLLLKGLVCLYLTAFLIRGFWEAAAAEDMSIWTFGLFAGGTYIGLNSLCYLSDSVKIRRKNIYPITLAYQGKVQSSYGLYDTGNMLSDPVKGVPVSIAKPEILETLLTGELVDKLRHLEENPGELEGTELAGLHPRFLPYKTVGNEGMMLAVTLEDLCIFTPREVVHVADPVLALSFEPSTLGKEYKVLLNFRLLH